MVYSYPDPAVEGYVQCELVALSQTTNLPYRLLTSLRQALLAQFTSLPITAACLWQEMKDTAAFIPTGRHDTHTHAYTHTLSPSHTLLIAERFLKVSMEDGQIEHPLYTVCKIYSVDQLLEGGVLTGELTELTGIPSSGKTQVL